MNKNSFHSNLNLQIFFKRIVFFFLIFFSSIVLQAQTFEINLKFQASGLMEYNTFTKKNNFTAPSPLPPFEPNLGFTIYPVEDIGVEIKAGIVFFPYEHFVGWEYSFLGKYYCASWFYVLGGYLIHLNSGGSSIGTGRSGADIDMYGLGIGFKASKLISFDLIFFDLKDQYIQSYRDWTAENVPFRIINLKWILKVNFGFNWQL